MPRLVMLSIWLGLNTCLNAVTLLDFWHDYIPPDTGQLHHGFHLANFNRGLFFGSCGLSLKSQQWAFVFDLTGNGLVFGPSELNVRTDDGKQLHIIAGQITLDQNQTMAVIALKVRQDTGTNDFIGNGTFQIKKLK